MRLLVAWLVGHCSHGIRLNAAPTPQVQISRKKQDWGKRVLGCQLHIGPSLLPKLVWVFEYLLDEMSVLIKRIQEML